MLAATAATPEKKEKSCYLLNDDGGGGGSNNRGGVYFSVVLKFPNLTSKSFINNNINIPLSQAIILKFLIQVLFLYM